MTFWDLLPPDRIRVPLRLEVGSAGALVALLRDVRGEGSEVGHEAESIWAELRESRARQDSREGPEHLEDREGREGLGVLEGRDGRARVVGAAGMLVLVEGGTEDAAAFGVIPTDAPDEEGFRIFLVVQRSRKSVVSAATIDALAGALSDPNLTSGLLACGPGDIVRFLEPVLRIPLEATLRVSDAFEPSSYRIFPDARLEEILDLMTRKSVSALPVVGTSLQVIGIVTASDILRAALQRGAGDSIDARQLMSRAVLCVTEDQSLRDAARMMVQRELAQLPVVRNGEWVGFLSREAVLKRLFSGSVLNEEAPKP